MSTNLKQGAIIHGEKNTYTIEKMLGQGSFGITYLARYKVKVSGAMGSGYVTAQVCIKEFFMKDFNTRDEQTGSLNDTSGVTIVERYRKAFMREAKNLARMQHPGIVNVFEVIEANNTVYIVMEYIDGGSLDDYIHSKGRLSEVESLRCMLPICEAMDYMHRCRMLHLDMKPKNVMRDTEGHLYLIDFGLSRQYDANGEPESSTSIGLGTPGYAPIEQAVQKIDDEHNFRATIDVYALGATLYKMLTGQTPPLAIEVSGAIVDGEDLIQQNLTQIGISEGLAQTVSKAMWPSSKKRVQSVADLLSCLRASIPMGEDALIKAYDDAIDYVVNAPLIDNSWEDDSENTAKSKNKDSDTKGEEDTTNLEAEAQRKAEEERKRKAEQERLRKEAEAKAAKKRAEAEARAKAEQKRKAQPLRGLCGLLRLWPSAASSSSEPASKKPWLWGIAAVVALALVWLVWPKSQSEVPPVVEPELIASTADSIKEPAEQLAVDTKVEPAQLEKKEEVKKEEPAKTVEPKTVEPKKEEPKKEEPKKEAPITFRSGTHNGHDYVDLGLTDSNGRTIYWATCNVGASKPENYGLYFAWGETKGYTRDTNDGHEFNWANYKWCNGTEDTMTKYCTQSKYGTVDNKTELDPEDDAAHVNWGGNWRMPTRAELDQLKTKCQWTWDESRTGYQVKGPNGNSLFLPAFHHGFPFGAYWSSLLYYSNCACCLCISSTLVHWANDDPRYRARMVRAVCTSSE